MVPTLHSMADTTEKQDTPDLSPPKSPQESTETRTTSQSDSSSDVSVSHLPIYEQNLEPSILYNLLEVTSMTSKLSNLSSSNTAIRNDLVAIGADINAIFESFSSHLVMHPIVAPVDGTQQSTYYGKLFIGRYAQKLIWKFLNQNQYLSHEYHPYDIERLLRNMSETRRLPSVDHLILQHEEMMRWQSLLPLWRASYEGPNKEEILNFFKDLRFSGLCHVPQTSHCTCTEDFRRLFLDVARLCVRLRYSLIEFSFSTTEMLSGSLDIQTDSPAGKTMNCVLPSLKIRRSSVSWIHVFRGYGIAPTVKAGQQGHPRQI